MTRGGKARALLSLSILALSLGSCGRKTQLKLPAIPKLFSVRLQWDPNVDAVAGYRIYWGVESRNYLVSVDVGDTHLAQVDYLPRGLLFFAATAYNSAGGESDFSNEVSTRLTLADPEGMSIFLDTANKTLTRK
jgi:hypothetical protein